MPRDFSSLQYNTAAERQGFKRTPFGLEDISGRTPGVVYGSILDDKMKVRRRSTLANAMRRRQIRAAN